MKKIGVILSVLIQLSLVAYTQEAGRLLVTTGASFLTVNPDSRGNSLGGSGVATSPDMNSQYWNAAKYQFAESKGGISMTYSPWLRNIFDDMYLGSLSTFKKVSELETIGASMRYFTGGNIEFQELGSMQKTNVKPFELALDISYVRQLGDCHSASLTFRYTHSDLKLSQAVGSEGFHASRSVAVDLGFYYLKEFVTRRKKDCLSYGVQISNIGSRISYADEMKYFPPTLFRLGASFKKTLLEDHFLTIGMEMSKYLVPSKVVNYNSFEKSEEDNNYSVIGGIFRSLSDSPDGLEGELKEINWSASIEYSFKDQLFVRLGYFLEHPENGNRKFLGTGVGLLFKSYKLDLSYIVPNERYHPLANTFQVSVGKQIW